jgi:hypothetical protein
MFHFKEKYDSGDIALALFSISISEELVEKCIKTYLKEILPNTPNMYKILKWNTEILRLSVCEFACVRVYGETDFKTSIIDDFFILVNRHLSTRDKNKQGRQLITNYNECLMKKDHNILEHIGKMFAESIMGHYDDVLLLMAGSVILGETLKSMESFLKGLTITK